MCLTDIKDEGVAESVVSVVAPVDQELRVGDHRAAVPAVSVSNESSCLICLDPAVIFFFFFSILFQLQLCVSVEAGTFEERGLSRRFSPWKTPSGLRKTETFRYE